MIGLLTRRSSLTKADVTASPLPYESFRTDSCPDMLTVGLFSLSPKETSTGIEVEAELFAAASG
jgi:hypothetical protein